MATKQKNKIVFGNEVLIDLTADTVTADKILATYTAHDASGTSIVGTCDFDVNSQDATVMVDEILTGKTAYARGTKLSGAMPNQQGKSFTISAVGDSISIPKGFYDGSGSVSILSTEQAKLIAANIKEGITILGVTGNLKPSSSVTAHAKNVTPSRTQQTILPDVGYDYLSQVTVAAIPYTETDNSAGGTTVTIG